ncbi:hypothetical protein L9F63_014058 [Diploptera punctata]|uniref:Cyclin N-terminal domain-containing protein n=1 Tax=Diploptera punctata TaxID=6984 RepID=A0AAD8ELG7_DIPPU|nr:hypothetical protein L9F63_014058 [Diploptera punctata]
MAQVKRSTRFGTTKNLENVYLVGKDKLPAATKRTVLGEIGNELPRGRGVLIEKKITKPVVVAAKKESKPKGISKNVVSLPPRSLRQTQSTSNIIACAKPVKKAESCDNLVEKEPVEDIDKYEEDPLQVKEYVNDIFDYLREVEAKFPIKENYLEGQNVTGKMRALLVDWLVEVQVQFRLMLETLYLTVSIIDRYLQVRTVTKNKLQLLGASAMLVACKYEEMYLPVVADFVYICDNAYTNKEILQMEQIIVRTLEFNFSRPIALQFLRRYSKAAHSTMKNHMVAKYFLELCLVEYEMCHYPPSLISAAAIYLSLWVFSPGNIWTNTLKHYTTYTYDDIKPVVKKIAKIVLRVDSTKYKAIPKKYGSSKFLKVSCMPELSSSALHKFASAS